ncbi:MAG: phage terminase large subunit [Clostridiales bacterium]|nr:phage terminase large subunit [Clostridiales bacterium]
METIQKISFQMLPETEMNVQSAIIASQSMQAISTASGSTRASEFIIGLAGEDTEKESTEAVYTELPACLLGSEWADVNRSIDEREFVQYDFRGGRGSLKSSFCAEKLVDIIMRDKEACALAVRELKDDTGASVYAQIVWVIDEMGLTEQFRCTKSPYEIKRKVRTFS